MGLRYLRQKLDLVEANAQNHLLLASLPSPPAGVLPGVLPEALPETLKSTGIYNVNYTFFVEDSIFHLIHRFFL